MNGYEFITSVLGGLGFFIFIMFYFFSDEIKEMFETWAKRKR